MAQSRFYSAIAQPTVLTASITPTTPIIQVQQVVGFPVNTPYILALDYSTPSEEIVLVTAAAGTNLTVTRGYDGTSATAHNAGAAVRHTWTAMDGNDSRAHEGSTAGVHGVTGNVVGTTDTQTLTNKTLTNAVLTSPTITGTANINSPNIVGNVSGGANYQNITATTTSVSASPLQVMGMAGQTNPLQLWQDSTPSTLARVRSTGEISSNVGLQCGSSNQFAVSSTGNVVAPSYRATSMASSSFEDSTAFTTSANAYSGMNGSATIVVPPSGKVKIDAMCRMSTNVANGEMWCSISVVGSTSGTIRGVSDSTAMYFACPSGGGNASGTAAQSIIVTSANPGETLTITLRGKAGTQASITATSNYRAVSAVPMVG